MKILSRAVSLALISSVAFAARIDRVWSLLARKVALKECSREAHGNPYIDNCGSSRWELVGREDQDYVSCPTCGEGAHINGCSKPPWLTPEQWAGMNEVARLKAEACAPARGYKWNGKGWFK